MTQEYDRFGHSILKEYRLKVINLFMCSFLIWIIHPMLFACRSIQHLQATFASSVTDIATASAISFLDSKYCLYCLLLWLDIWQCQRHMSPYMKRNNALMYAECILYILSITYPCNWLENFCPNGGMAHEIMAINWLTN